MVTGCAFFLFFAEELITNLLKSHLKILHAEELTELKEAKLKIVELLKRIGQQLEDKLDFHRMCQNTSLIRRLLSSGHLRLLYTYTSNGGSDTKPLN